MKKVEERLLEIQNKRLLAIFPHPDDESFNVGGLVQRAKRMGWEVRIIILTKGEKGKNHLGKGDLAVIRENEAEEAVKILGSELKMWAYPDGGLREEKVWVTKMEKEIAAYDPGLVVSYDFSGMSGHPDHISLSKELFEVLKKKKGIVLWWSVWPGIARQFMIHPEVSSLMQEPALRLDLNRSEQVRKFKAMKAHRSQWPNLKWWQRVLLRLVIGREYFAIADFTREYEYRYVGFEF